MGADRLETNDLSPGAVINGKYRILSLLATGGMGHIYRAEQAPLGRVVVVKVLRTPQVPSDAIAAEFRKRFDREASILAKLQHANIVTLFDYGRIDEPDGDRYFMVMELLAGETLAQRIKTRQVLPVRETLRIVRQIARGLREAHRLGAVHRDLKPSNVMLVPEDDGEEIVKILDFGIGKLEGDDQELTQEGAFLGSPKYIAPEQVNDRRVDARTDVYALGIIAYECLCGRVPFEGETNLETILAHYHRELPWMIERNPDVQVPDVVESFVRRCLEKRPDARPQTMEEVLRHVTDCERALFGGASGTFRGASPSSSQDSRAIDLDAPLSQRVVARPMHAEQTLSLAPTPRPSIGTASPLTRSQPPPAGSPSSRPVAFFGVVAIVLLGIGVLSFRIATRARAAATVASAPVTIAAPAADRTFTLVVASQPPGAQVVDGDAVVGVTPLQVTVDRSSVKDGPRRYTLRLEGYAPYAVLQGDAEGTVRVEAALEALAPPTPGAEPPAATHAPPRAPEVPPQAGRQPEGRTRTPPQRASSLPPPRQDPDIKLQR